MAHKDLTEEEYDELLRTISGFLPDEAWVLVAQAENGTQIITNLGDADQVLLILENGKTRINDGPPSEDAVIRRDS